MEKIIKYLSYLLCYSVFILSGLGYIFFILYAILFASRGLMTMNIDTIAISVAMGMLARVLMACAKLFNPTSPWDWR